jgi:hypothetical protein
MPTSQDEQFRKLERKAEQEPENIDAQRNLACAYRRQNRLEDTLRTLLKAGLFVSTEEQARWVGEELKKQQLEHLKTLKSQDVTLLTWPDFPEEKRSLSSAEYSAESPVILGLDLVHTSQSHLDFDPTDALWLQSLTDTTLLFPEEDIAQWPSRLPFLTHLNISFWDLGSEGVEYLKQMQSLKKLEILIRGTLRDKTLFTDPNLRKTLVHLDCSLSEEDLSTDFSPCSSLFKLTLSCTIDQPVILDTLFPEITENLALSNFIGLSKRSLASFMSLPKIKDLTLRSKTTSMVYCPLLSHCPLLEKLVLHLPNAIKCLDKVPRPEILQSLTVYSTVTDRDIDALSRFINLKELVISGHQISRTAIPRLRNNLKKLIRFHPIVNT